VEFLDIGTDCHITNSPENGFKIAGVIRQFKPEIVLAPSLTPHQHPDHLAVGQIAYNACRYSRYAGLQELKTIPPHAVNFLYHYAIHAELGHGPDVIIDVSETHDKWEKAMKLHTSQMKTKSYIDLVNSKAAYYGKSIGVSYAVGLWSNDPIRVDSLSDLELSSRNY
jgi:LmbE family N-acetylglucosaminyl deacetylase